MKPFVTSPPPRHRESARSINIVTATIVAHLSLKPDFGTNQLLPETAAAKNRPPGKLTFPLKIAVPQNVTSVSSSFGPNNVQSPFHQIPVTFSG
jgi:hypothetical protein